MIISTPGHDDYWIADPCDSTPARTGTQDIVWINDHHERIRLDWHFPRYDGKQPWLEYYALCEAEAEKALRARGHLGPMSIR